MQNFCPNCGHKFERGSDRPGIIAEAIKMLDATPRGSRAMTTKEVALLLRKSGRRAEPLPTLEKSLMKGVQTLPSGYATHDGETYKLYGREFTRWRWWGQMERGSDTIG